MNSESKHLAHIVKSTTGDTIKGICNKIGVKYASFMHRHKAGKIHVPDYLKISKLTSMPLDTLLASDPRFQEEVNQFVEENNIHLIEDHIIDTPIVGFDPEMDVKVVKENESSLTESIDTASDDFVDFPFEDV